ncbi:MAG: MBL fold metallo-hydrolase [Spirochaetales bacterium]|nr:MBL fold metallo-hydrolase [Spirochaetales bacterium]
MRFFPHYVISGFSNMYLLADDESREAALIDPGYFDGELLKLIESHGLTVSAVLVTHAHESHIAGIATLLRIYEAKIYSFRPKILDYPTIPTREGDVIRVGKLRFDVIETPGHSRDSLSFRVANLLFTGDTLTAGLTGTAAHDQAHHLLLSSIRKSILTLPDDTIIFPGHGPPTRVCLERADNAMLNELCPRSRSSSAFF